MLVLLTNTRAASTWSNVPQGPPVRDLGGFAAFEVVITNVLRLQDAILGITEAFKADGFKDKINLGVGAYRMYWYP